MFLTGLDWVLVTVRIGAEGPCMLEDGQMLPTYGRKGPGARCDVIDARTSFVAQSRLPLYALTAPPLPSICKRVFTLKKKMASEPTAFSYND